MKDILLLVSLLFSFQSMAAVGDTFSFQFNQDIPLARPSDGSDRLTAQLFMGQDMMSDGPKRVFEVQPGGKSVRGGCLIERATSPEVNHSTIKGEGGQQWNLTLLKHEKDEKVKEYSIGLGFGGNLMKAKMSVYNEEFELKNADGSTTLKMSCRSTCVDSTMLGKQNGVSCENRIAAEEVLNQMGVNLPKPIPAKSEEKRQENRTASGDAGTY